MTILLDTSESLDLFIMASFLVLTMVYDVWRIIYRSSFPFFVK